MFFLFQYADDDTQKLIEFLIVQYYSKAANPARLEKHFHSIDAPMLERFSLGIQTDNGYNRTGSHVTDLVDELIGYYRDENYAPWGREGAYVAVNTIHVQHLFSLWFNYLEYSPQTKLDETVVAHDLSELIASGDTRMILIDLTAILSDAIDLNGTKLENDP